MDRLPTFEAGTTVQLTWTSNVPPDSAPLVAVRSLPEATLVASATAVASSSTSYHCFFTLPDHADRRHWLAEWRAVKTFQGTPYPFVQRSAFLSENSSPNL